MPNNKKKGKQVKLMLKMADGTKIPLSNPDGVTVTNDDENCSIGYEENQTTPTEREMETKTDSETIESLRAELAALKSQNEELTRLVRAQSKQMARADQIEMVEKRLEVLEQQGLDTHCGLYKILGNLVNNVAYASHTYAWHESQGHVPPIDSFLEAALSVVPPLDASFRDHRLPIPLRRNAAACDPSSSAAPTTTTTTTTEIAQKR